MTPEEKQLLLKDLCGRLSYGTEISLVDGTSGMITSISIVLHGTFVTVYFNRDNVEDVSLEDIKPYLRSMSSMTKEEKKELSARYVWEITSGKIQIRYHSEGYWDNDTECQTEEYLWLFDWLNAHHFDYRGLTEKELALEAPEGMYETE